MVIEDKDVEAIKKAIVFYYMEIESAIEKCDDPMAMALLNREWNESKEIIEKYFLGDN